MLYGADENVKMNADNAIEVNQLTKIFGAFTAVDRLDFEVKQGEIFGFLGANGAGKTTAMRMLCGLLLPSSGQATVAGFDVFRQRDQIKKHIGYMSQKFSLYEDLSIRENIRFYGGVYRIPRPLIKSKSERLISQLELEPMADKLVRELPLGWKQRLAFSVAMLHDPKIVFLDEPTGGVDPITRRQFWEMIYRAAVQRVTVFVTTHYMDEAEYCHRVSIMVDGRINALGTPAELKKKYQAAHMNEVFLQLARVARARE